VAQPAVKIRWTAVAAEDLKSAHEYVSEQSPARADELIERILAAIDVLERYPQMGRPGRVTRTRELVIAGTPFIVVFRLHRDQVQILSILHAARKWPDNF
jgi:toxin ParE1/3/4